MQFVTGGPDVPEHLLQSHEEGRVVFFCGAGVSFPAGLPGFERLVKLLYEGLHPSPNSVHRAAIKSKQFDTAIGLLEDAIVGGRKAVRRELARLLTPIAMTPKATATHEALLTLGKTREGRLRLVTTNFDRLFEAAIKTQSLTVECFHAPLLPVPKRHWDGLVYLHGLLTETPTDNDLDRLVVSSGDFGLAYLTERWAARFVSEMFRYCTVCFIGYSLSDPVLRYMMDALAADRQKGESPPEMFAFGSYSKGKEDQRADEWRAKNVTPILYREREHHRYLHKTLHTWAANYRDGARGKESIVVQHAGTLPLASTKEDDFAGRLLWALSDASGLPAKRFADFDPVPALDWLGPLSERGFVHRDLSRFGVVPQAVVDDALRFALLYRPAPYSKAPWMSVAQWGEQASDWDEPMIQLARWLTRHLDDPKLLLWVAKAGGRLHPSFAGLIEDRLEEFDRLEMEGKTGELARIRANARNAIPRPKLRALWRLAIADCLKTPDRGVGLYGWKRRLPKEGVTTALRMEWCELLAPRIALREPFGASSETPDPGEPERLKSLLDWEIVLSSDNTHSAVKDMARLPAWRYALPDLLDDTQRLLYDALNMMRELGEADDHNDRGHWDLPSVSEHPQNRGFRDWTALIELLRDAWLATLERDPTRARRIAEDWWAQPFPTFKRLALFAATQVEL